LRTSGPFSLNECWLPERGARMARREDREYREHLREEQHRQPGCPAPKPVLERRRQAAKTCEVRRWVATMGLASLVVFGAACRQDMHDQPSYSALEASTFFEDGASARLPVPGTVARGQLHIDDELLYTGVANGRPALVFPFPIDQDVMERGQVSFNAYCSPCHGQSGRGDGVIVQRGFTQPPDLTDSFMSSSPLGHLFNVITNGFGAMPDHGSQIKVRDRWAIIAYVKALQLAASATLEDVPVAERGRLDQQP